MERNGIKRIFNKQFFTSQIFFLISLIILMGIVATIFNPNFFSTRNLLNILNQNAVLAMVAAGGTLVMISGNLDVSVGSLVGLTTTFSALLVVNGVNIYVAMLLGVLLSVVCELINGVVIAKTRTPSFIITLAMLSVFHGISLVITGGTTQSLRGQFYNLGRGYLFGVIPNPIVVCLILYFCLFVILRYTKFGRKVYAVGGNEEAAYLSGIDADKIKIIGFLINGLFVGIASIVLLSRLGSALPSTGSGMELRAIAAIVIGGVPLMGGRGRALGTFLGIILMGMISNVLNLLNISAYYQEVVIGIIIAVAVIVSNIGNMKRR